MSLMKPAMWAFTPGLVDPNWQWFWGDDLLATHIFWEGQGDPLELVGKKLSSLGSGVGWTASAAGTALDFPGTTRIVEIGAQKLQDVSFPFTFLVVMRATAFDAAIQIIIQSSDWDDQGEVYSGAAFAIRDEFRIQTMIGANTGKTGAHRRTNFYDNVALHDGDVHIYGVSVTGLTTGECYVDGKLERSAPDATSGTTVGFASSSFLGRIGAGNFPIAQGNVTLIAWALFNRELTASEHLQFAQDFSGPFRMADEARVVYSLPAAGGAFPPPFSRRLNTLLRM